MASDSFSVRVDVLRRACDFNNIPAVRVYLK